MQTSCDLPIEASACVWQVPAIYKLADVIPLHNWYRWTWLCVLCSAPMFLGGQIWPHSDKLGQHCQLSLHPERVYVGTHCSN